MLFSAFAPYTGELSDSKQINADTHRSQIYERRIINSPDGALTAVVQGGADQWSLNGRTFFEVWVGKSSLSHAGYQLAFSSEERVFVYWGGKDSLVIELGRTADPEIQLGIPPIPKVMLHRIGNLHISYQTSAKLSEQFYREELEEYEQKQRINLSAFARQTTPVERWSWIQDLWGRYLTFRDWLPADDDPGRRLPPLNRQFDVETVLVAPDGMHTAMLSSSHEAEQPEGTASYLVKIAGHTDPQKSDEFVFYALGGKPHVRWDTPANLVITVGYLSCIHTSAGQAGDVAVNYRLTESMREFGFRNRLERQKWYLEETQPPFPPRPPEEQKELAARLEYDVQHYLERYKEFQQWVEKNVEEGGR